MKMTAQQIRVWASARRYLASGFSVIPCKANKKPSGEWREFTVRRATLKEISIWFEDHKLPSIGVVLGAVSHNVVAIDLDGIPAIKEFAAAYPKLCENTRSVLTGSQKGIHLYVRVDEIPDNINVRVPGIGGFEIRGNGQYVIAPPSPHPSGYLYRVYRDNSILKLPHVHDIRAWMENLREQQQENQSEIINQAVRPHDVSAHRYKVNYLNKVVSEEIAKVEIAREGNRNNALFYAALKLANYAAGGELDWSEMSQLLYRAGCGNADNPKEVERTIASAWRIGSQRPKQVNMDKA